MAESVAMAELELIIGNKNYSSWSLRPWLFLRHHGVPFQETRIPFDSPDWHALVARHSPARKVPVLIVDGFAIWDSLAILEHLHESLPELGGWPTAVQARARARSVAADMHSSFVALRTELPQDCRARLERRRFSEAAEADIERVQEIWRDCLAQSGGPWLFGAFGIADAMFAPVALRFVSYGVELEPDGATYVHQVEQLPAIQEWLRESEGETEGHGPF